jgi:hypothetical protein
MLNMQYHSQSQSILYAVVALSLLGLLIYNYLIRRASRPEAPVPRGTLLFVEDLDGHDGMMAGQFGDLVTYHPDSGERHVLTRDGHFARHPSWGPDGCYLLFESKRGRRGGSWSMSERSSIYRYDLETGKITPWGRDLAERFRSVVGEDMRYPAVSPDGRRVAFVTPDSNESINSLVVVYNAQHDTVQVVLRGQMYQRLVWADDGEHLLISARPASQTLAGADSHLFAWATEADTARLLESPGATQYYGDIYRGRVLYVETGVRGNASSLLETGLGVQTTDTLWTQPQDSGELMYPTYATSPDTIFIWARPRFQKPADAEELLTRRESGHALLRLDVSRGKMEELLPGTRQRQHIAILR